jgi:hypothetical protein
MTNVTGLPLTTAVTGTLPVANGGTGTTTSTGTGSVVLATGPTVTLGNATGLPLTTGVTGTLPVANGGTGTTTSTGSGSVVLATTPTVTALREVQTAVSASNIDLSAGNYFSKTISGTTTFTVSNVPSSGTVASFILDMTNGGSATVNFWSGVKWSYGTAPPFTASGRDVLGFFTYDGGTTWTGLLLGTDIK